MAPGRKGISLTIDQDNKLKSISVKSIKLLKVCRCKSKLKHVSCELSGFARSQSLCVWILKRHGEGYSLISITC